MHLMVLINALLILFSREIFSPLSSNSVFQTGAAFFYFFLFLHYFCPNVIQYFSFFSASQSLLNVSRLPTHTLSIDVKDDLFRDYRLMVSTVSVCGILSVHIFQLILSYQDVRSRKGEKLRDIFWIQKSLQFKNYALYVWTRQTTIVNV